MLNQKVHYFKGRTFSTRNVISKRHEVEEVSCCGCHTYFTDEFLTWVDPVTGEDGYEGTAAPFCPSCYSKEILNQKLAA